MPNEYSNFFVIPYLLDFLTECLIHFPELWLLKITKWLLSLQWEQGEDVWKQWSVCITSQTCQSGSTQPIIVVPESMDHMKYIINLQ